MNLIRHALILLAGLLVFTVAAASAQDALVVVNGDSITTNDLDRLFAGIHSGMSHDKKMNFDYRKLVDRLVNDRLMLQEAEAIGLADDEAFVDFMADEKEKNIVRRFIKQNYRFDREVSDDAVADYFDKNYHKIQVRTISTPTRALADTLRELIESGAAMDSLAKLHSIDVHRYQGGAHSLKYYAEIENDVRAYLDDPKVGQLTGPVPYREAYILIRVEEIKPADREELPALSGYINGVLTTELRKTDWQEFVDSLIGTLDLTRNQALIDVMANSNTTVLDSSFMSGSETVVASLAGRENLTDADLRYRTAKIAMNAATAPPDSLVNAAFQEWLRDKALVLAGEAAGLADDPMIAKTLENTRDSALVEIYLKETIVSQIVFNREEFTAYYNDHQEEFREPGKFYLRRMIVSDALKADSAYQMLQDGGDFDYVMDRFITEDRRLVEKSEWVSMNAFPEEIRKELESLPVGAASKPYQTPDGSIIFKVLEKKEGRLKEQDEVEMQIREVMFQRQFNKLLDETLALLKEHSEITYNDEAIDRYLGGSK